MSSTSRAQSVQREQLAAIVPSLLGLPDHLTAAARRVHVEAFYTYLERCAVDWHGSVVRGNAGPTGVALGVRVPGRSALFMVPDLRRRGWRATDVGAALGAELALLGARALHFGQILLDPDDREGEAIVRGLGFEQLAQLEYRKVEPSFAAVPAAAAGVRWGSGEEVDDSTFADTIAGTYVDSQDCPDLNGIRPMADVVAAHRAAGLYQPQYWQMAYVDGVAAGCVLVTPLAYPGGFELVYLGVLPAFRGRGLGRVLTERAVHLARAGGGEALYLAVDARNGPARRVYEAAGFVTISLRNAYVYRWQVR